VFACYNKKIVRTGGVTFLRFQNWRRGCYPVLYAFLPIWREKFGFVFQMRLAERQRRQSRRQHH
jgi:hypothetical protein